MKAALRILKHLPLLLLACCPTVAAISIPGVSGTPVEGIDGPFTVPTGTTFVDLSTAQPGAWDSAPKEGTQGVYDAEKWAVVYKYSSVNIPAGAVVKFKNNASRAPVVWLVSGNVVVDGELYLNGDQVTVSQDFKEPGPGGFRSGSVQGGSGFGPGGGNALGRGRASHRVQPDSDGGPAYGDPELRTLIGGSGGATRSAAGAGAILIVATGRILINNLVQAYGLTAASGGSIRLVASEIDGSGMLDVRSAQASPGLIRVEAESFGSGNLSVFPPDYSLATVSGPVSIWPDSSAATARIVSVSNIPVVADPKAVLGVGPADVTVPANGSRTVRIETRNFPITGSVKVFVVPILGGRSELDASLVPGGTRDVAFWEANLDPALSGRAALQARAVAQ